MLAAMLSRTKTALACLLGVALAVPAIAQSGSVTQYPNCPDPPPKLSQTELDAAHASYKVGVEAYDSNDYQKALDNFKDAFRRDCSRVALLNFIARAYEGKGDRAEAIHALETYLQRSPKASDAETVQNRIQNLRALMQQPSSTTTTTTTTTATATTTASATTAPTATATATATTEGGGHTVGPWVVVGIGAAAIIPGVIVAVVGKGQVDAARTACPMFKCDPKTTPVPGYTQNVGDLDNQGTLLENLGIAIAAVGLAAVIGGVIWHFAEPTGAKKASAYFLPSFSPGYAGFSFGAKF
jgi:tetratricopeptide (TPR) repeat protein